MRRCMVSRFGFTNGNVAQRGRRPILELHGSLHQVRCACWVERTSALTTENVMALSRHQDSAADLRVE